jgi:hypothetical protein
VTNRQQQLQGMESSRRLSASEILPMIRSLRERIQAIPKLEDRLNTITEQVFQHHYYNDDRPCPGCGAEWTDAPEALAPFRTVPARTHLIGCAYLRWIDSQDPDA